MQWAQFIFLTPLRIFYMLWMSGTISHSFWSIPFYHFFSHFLPYFLSFFRHEISDLSNARKIRLCYSFIVEQDQESTEDYGPGSFSEGKEWYFFLKKIRGNIFIWIILSYLSYELLRCYILSVILIQNSNTFFIPDLLCIYYPYIFWNLIQNTMFNIQVNFIEKLF